MRVFFFSSRRRHTRYIGDWSSDVCSSDLSDIRVVDVCDRRDVRAYHVELLDAPEPLLLPGHGDLTLPLYRRDEQHVGRVAVQLEVLAHALPQHAGSEGAKAFAELDLQVHLRLHARA